MAKKTGKPLSEYLALQYTFKVVADPGGGYVIFFPDLPGCMTQVETLDQIPTMVEEARTLWLETVYDKGEEIPLPTYPKAYSGKFNLRLPRLLHRQLAESAEREGVSLNQYVVSLLSRRDAERSIEARLEALEAKVADLAEDLAARRRVKAVGEQRPDCATGETR